MLEWRVGIGLQRRADLPCAPTLDKPPSRSIPIHFGNFLPCNMLQTFPVSPFTASLSQKQGGRGYWSYQFKLTATGLKTGHSRETNRPASEGGRYNGADILRLSGHGPRSFSIRSYLSLSPQARHSPQATHHFLRPSPVANRESPLTHRVQIQWHTAPPEEACGKLIFGGNAGLTYWRRVLILASSLVTTLLDRGVEQTLFDNLIDVPESVRPYSSPSSVNGDFE